MSVPQGSKRTIKKHSRAKIPTLSHIVFIYSGKPSCFYRNIFSCCSLQSLRRVNVGKFVRFHFAIADASIVTTCGTVFFSTLMGGEEGVIDLNNSLSNIRYRQSPISGWLHVKTYMERPRDQAAIAIRSIPPCKCDFDGILSNLMSSELCDINGSLPMLAKATTVCPFV